MKINNQNLKLLLKIHDYFRAIEYYELLTGIKKQKNENNPELAPAYFEEYYMSKPTIESGRNKIMKVL